MSERGSRRRLSVDQRRAELLRDARHDLDAAERSLERSDGLSPQLETAQLGAARAIDAQRAPSDALAHAIAARRIADTSVFSFLLRQHSRLRGRSGLAPDCLLTPAAPGPVCAVSLAAQAPP